MHARIPFAVAVVGVLLVGGATTGTTRAAWADGADLQAASVGSGTMGNAAAASPTGLTVQRGGSATSRVAVTDTSGPAAPNLRQRITPSLTGSLPTGVTATLTTVGGGGACTGTPQGPVVLTAGGSLTTCVTVAAAPTSTATSAIVTVAIDGTQELGGSAPGWSTPTRTVSIPVTIQGPAPVLSCSPGAGAGGVFVFSWLAVPGVLSYQVQTSGDGTGFGLTLTVNAGPSSHTHAALLAKNDVLYVRVVATATGGGVATSNVLRLERRGNSSNVDCEDLG